MNFSAKNRHFFSAEWTYLLTTRKVGDEDSAFSYVRIKYGDHTTDTVTGVIIYPDDFSFSEVGVATLKFGSKHGIQGEIDKATWEALESAGCIFLPGSRNRYFSDGQPSINEANYGLNTYYWSATANSASNAYNASFNFNGRSINPAILDTRYSGFAVRLIQDF